MPASLARGATEAPLPMVVRGEECGLVFDMRSRAATEAALWFLGSAGVGATELK